MRVLFWFRKDLRLADNTGLHQAARDARGEVVPFYASDPAILGREDIATIRVRFVLDSLAELAAALDHAGARLVLDHGPAVETLLAAARRAEADAVYWNDEYEPALRSRDDAVESALQQSGIGVRRFDDRLLAPPGEVLNAAGKPYVVYSRFRQACEALPLGSPFPAVSRLTGHGLASRVLATPERLGFTPSARPWPGGERAARARLERFVAHGLARYATHRDQPAADAHSRLSADLKFGTLSPRTVAAAVGEAAAADPRLGEGVAKYVSELRWRDFYAHILYHFPHCERTAFQPRYQHLRWPGDPRHLDAWRDGRTGYPLVDAGMRQLAGEGFMHNRVRMVVASFLVKDLLLHWRLGERHFMRHLVDGDLASNNGGWQWAASTGTDAQPYFRVFNPVLQGERFDPEGAYVKRWVPELSRLPARWVHRPWEAPAAELARAGVRLDADYPRPIVDHGERRRRAVELFGAAATPAVRGRARTRRSK